MELEIVQGTPEELERAWEIVKSAVDYMGKQGNPQWDKTCPTRADIARSLEQGTVFLARCQGVVGGMVVLDDQQWSQYAQLTWSTPANSLVIHKMAVDQAFMGRGIATAFFRFAQEEALRQGRRGIRGDTYHKNLPMRRRYEKAGFTCVGAIQLPGQQPGDYFCFEKKV